MLKVDKETPVQLEDMMGQIVEVAVSLITPDPENLRQEFDEEDLRDLGRNMLEVGQLDEITLFPIVDQTGKWTGTFDLHDGERRWRAAQFAGIQFLRAKIEARPSKEELLYKKLSRMLQTRGLNPERKVRVLEESLKRLGVVHQPESWDSYREKLGGGVEWPQLIRVLKLNPKVRGLMERGLVNFTLAQSIGRLPLDRQEEAARFVVADRISGRFFSTQMVPYLLANPDATLAQAFEHTKVGDWKQYTKSPYQKGQGPPTDEKIERFLEACVRWEREWEIVVHSGLVHELEGNAQYQYRLREMARRIIERATALFERLGIQRQELTGLPELSSPRQETNDDGD